MKNPFDIVKILQKSFPMRIVLLIVVLVAGGATGIYFLSRNNNSSGTSPTAMIKGTQYKVVAPIKGEVTFPELAIKIPWKPTDQSQTRLVYELLPTTKSSQPMMGALVTSEDLASRAPDGCQPWFGDFGVVPKAAVESTPDDLYDLRQSVVKEFRDGTVLTFVPPQYKCVSADPALIESYSAQQRAFEQALTHATQFK